MITFLIATVTETARVLYEGSLYILIGFFVAGLLHEFLPGGLIARHLGKRSPRSVLLAALFGAPIPLCSCGVLPAAAELRRKGASRPAVTSFLISTPETGVDSIALTYGLLGPVMAIVRPIVAIVSAVVAGMLAIVVRDDAPQIADEATGHIHGTDVIPEPDSSRSESAETSATPLRLRHARRRVRVLAALRDRTHGRAWVRCSPTISSRACSAGTAASCRCSR